MARRRRKRGGRGMSWLLAAVILLVLGAGGAYLVGLERVWALVGPADQGAIAFETLTRRPHPTDALAAPPGFGAAPADVQSPAYPVSPERLSAVLLKALEQEPDLTRVDDGSDPSYLRFVQRSRVMRFPDTIDVRIVPADGGGSSLAIYSRSQLGRADFGVNRARVDRWLAAIAMAAQG